MATKPSNIFAQLNSYQDVHPLYSMKCLNGFSFFEGFSFGD